MICPSCQGRGKVRIGPQPHDIRSCVTCNGTGNYKPDTSRPGHLYPQIGNPPTTSDVSPAAPPPSQSLEALLEGIDVVNRNLQDRHIEILREALRRDVRVIADHRIHSGEFTILVSPGDYARLKQENTNGAL